MEKDKGFSKILRLFVNVGCIAIALVVTAYLYWIPQPCDIDQQYLYCRTHPGSGFDVLGMILFWFCCIWLSGIWSYILKPKDDGDKIYKVLTAVAWGAGIAGMSLIYAL